MPDGLTGTGRDKHTLTIAPKAGAPPNTAPCRSGLFMPDGLTGTDRDKRTLTIAPKAGGAPTQHRTL